MPTAQPCSRLSKKGGVYGPSDLLRGGRRIGTFSRVPRRPYLRRLARCWDSVSGRRRTPPRDPAPLQAETGPATTRLATRYPGTCRTDRCRWAASCSQAPLHRPQSLPPRQAVFTIGLPAPISRLAFVGHPTDRAWARHQGARSGDRAAALRPPDLVRITRGFDPRHARHPPSSGGAVEQFRQLGFNDAEACEFAGFEAEPGRARYLLRSGCPPRIWRSLGGARQFAKPANAESAAIQSSQIWPARHPPREAPTRAQKCDLKVAERRWSATVVQTLVRYRCA